MECRACGKSIEVESAYCRFCGAAVTMQTPRRRLSRPTAEARLGGVCAGLARYLQVDVSLVRIAWVILTIVPGAVIGGVLAYVVAWLAIPASRPGEDLAPRSKVLERSSGDRWVGGVCGGLAEYFGVDAAAVRLAWVVLSIWPGVIVVGLFVYVVAWIVIPSAPEVRTRSAHA